MLNKRDSDLNQREKLSSFTTLETLAQRNESRLEMLKMSDTAKAKLASGLFTEIESTKLFADLILITKSIVVKENSQRVKETACRLGTA